MALLVIAAIVLRVLWLDRLPGVDGDEAWYGALAQRWAAGDLTFQRTPTGNYPGPIQVALVALGQFLMPSEFILLRLPTVLSSLAAMALAWWIGRRHVDAATGRLALLLFATLPANIVFARFGWDPSHSALIILGGIAFAIKQRLFFTLVVYALAVWTHPTNVFAAPLLLTVFISAERDDTKRVFTARNCLLVGVMGLITTVMMLTATQAGQFANINDVFARLVSPADWLAFALLLGRLMTGEPWFVHLAGAGYGALLPIADVIAMAMLAGTTWHTVRTVKCDGLTISGSLLLGWLAMVVSYALIGGSAPLNAPTERYAYVLVAPTALAFAITLGALFGRAAGTGREACGAAVIGVALIASTTTFYLVPLATRDGIGVNAFKTGPIEPKEATAGWVVAELHRRGPVRLVAEDWWLYWPLAYRLAGTPVTLVDAEAEPHEASRDAPGQTFDIVFANGPADKKLQVDPSARLTWTARGYDGRAVVRVWQRH